MKKTTLFGCLVWVILSSCNMNSPTEYFSRAALNCNFLYGFAGDVLHRQLAEPSVKLVNEKTLETAPMKKVEFLQTKIETIEKNLESINSLGNEADAAEMIKASKDLYAFVIPVYKNEYMQLAKLYDDGANSASIESAQNQIISKYQSKFLELYDKVWEKGKAYASKNGITVRESNPSPGNY